MANYTRCLPGCPHPRAKSTMKHQGFRWGHLVYGFQFHFEINAAMIQDRLGDKGCCTELAAVPEIKPEAIRRQPSLDNPGSGLARLVGAALLFRKVVSG